VGEHGRGDYGSGRGYFERESGTNAVVTKVITTGEV
jgi:hypothetical protein